MKKSGNPSQRSWEKNPYFSSVKTLTPTRFQYEINGDKVRPKLIYESQESLFFYNAVKGVQEYHQMYNTGVSELDQLRDLLYGIGIYK